MQVLTSLVNKSVTLKELLVGSLFGGLSYFLIAIFNISNEDVYNWDFALIFSKGGMLNSISLIALWCWYVVMAAWLIRLAVQSLRLFLIVLNRIS